MIFRSRRAASLATAALLASGAVAAFGVPAHAAGTETDLAITAAGTRMTDGVGGKIAWAKIANQGEGTPSKVLIKVDVSKLDDNKLIFVPITNGECSVTGETKLEVFTCELNKGEIPKPGETTEVPVVLVKGEDVSGPYTAPVTITIESPDDTDDSNNSIKIDVELTPESGVDLGVIVPDVKTSFDFDSGTEGKKLYPGDTALVYSEVVNQGNLTAQGLKLTFRLPEHVSLAFPLGGCETGAERTVVCDDKDFLLEQDTVLRFELPVVVDEDVEAPVALTGGSLEAVAHGALKPEARISKQATKPDFDRAEVREIEDSEFADIDPSDNTDDFAVIVAATGNGGGGGGGLPVTGVQAGVIGAVGGGVVLAGAAMLLVSRRRRVVLVAPGDEKSSS
ncbi:LPXTG cell wall anchor domain-containing protein [Micromonospora craniellae]|uniref:LPXTG cell wall anchor domain-containing protein n=1 Tax=Micromonospora craniellae TaxID=2294034 RepID=A0A372FW13_9ACTN|nr:LPXTG cell wall anchor domain-containing protein [Micromonospora craniellae]QOC94108.1 LPXTG cell wall anchor domain-containing protein [Micromonospora craniellae]RFS44710.1 LPXTG cell wall anchor domain-containing protein [Micromonospora craniellae]